MFVGELEYGDLPFNSHHIINYLTFIAFVYLVVLVMMNLLTGKKIFIKDFRPLNSLPISGAAERI